MVMATFTPHLNHSHKKICLQLLENIDSIRHIPTEIIQGRYDVVCPPTTAWALHEAWPEATFTLVQNAGHSAFDPANASALIAATDRFADR